MGSWEFKFDGNEELNKRSGIGEGKFGGHFKAAAKYVDEIIEVNEPNMGRHITQNHENILRLYCLHEENCSRFLIMEYCDISLEAYMKTKGNKVKPDFLFQIAVGVSWLHQRGIYHGRLHPRNILLKDLSVSRKRIVLADCWDSKSEYYKEWTLSDSPSQRNDIFAMGCIFYYILSKGQHPFKHEEQDNQVVKNIKDNHYHKHLDHIPQMVKHRSKLAQDLIENMINNVQPQNQPLINKYNSLDIVVHPFFWSTNKILMFIEKVASLGEKAKSEKSEHDLEWSSIKFPLKEFNLDGWLGQLDEAIKQYLLFSPRPKFKPTDTKESTQNGSSGEGKPKRKRQKREIETFLKFIRNKSVHWFSKHDVKLQQPAVTKMREILRIRSQTPNDRNINRDIFCYYWMIEFSNVIISVWKEAKAKKPPIIAEFFSITPTEYLHFQPDGC